MCVMGYTMPECVLLYGLNYAWMCVMGYTMAEVM